MIQSTAAAKRPTAHFDISGTLSRRPATHQERLVGPSGTAPSTYQEQSSDTSGTQQMCDSQLSHESRASAPHLTTLTTQITHLNQHQMVLWFRNLVRELNATIAQPMRPFSCRLASSVNLLTSINDQSRPSPRHNPPYKANSQSNTLDSNEQGSAKSTTARKIQKIARKGTLERAAAPCAPLPLLAVVLALRGA